MAQLSTIVSSILHDFIQAQHEANCYSLSLEREYGQHGKIKDFQLPNAVLGDLEFELRYAVKGEGDIRYEYEVDYVKLKRFYQGISEQLAKISVTSVVSTVSQASIGVDDDYDSYHQFMKKEEVLKHEFCAFLSRKFLGALTERTVEIIAADGNVNSDILLEVVMEVVRSEFLQHADLDELFKGKSGEVLRTEAGENLKYSLSGLVEKLLNDFNCVRKHSFPSVEVIVTADELKKLPEEAVQCIKFRITQQGKEAELPGEG